MKGRTDNPQARKNTATSRAFAKINLFLDVREKRSDGYHELATVMQRISIFDTVTVTAGDDGIYVDCDKEGLSGESNIAFRAAARFFAEARIKGGADISIKKRIPIAAGLGGGSSDAAAVICMLNEIYGDPLSDNELMEVGFSVGADVPFFISRQSTALVYGAGEKVVPCRRLTGCHFLLLPDGTKASTGEMYRKLDEFPLASVSEKAMIDAISEHNCEKIGKNLYNSFEKVVIQSDVRDIMSASDPLGVCLCGSGPFIFAMYKKNVTARRMEKMLRSRGYTVYLASPV